MKYLVKSGFPSKGLDAAFPTWLVYKFYVGVFSCSTVFLAIFCIHIVGPSTLCLYFCHPLFHTRNLFLLDLLRLSLYLYIFLGYSAVSYFIK